MQICYFANIFPKLNLIVLAIALSVKYHARGLTSLDYQYQLGRLSVIAV